MNIPPTPARTFLGTSYFVPAANRIAIVALTCIAFVLAAAFADTAEGQGRGAAVGPHSITLADILVGDVGAEAVFDVVQYETAEVNNASGLFVFMAEEDLVDNFARAARVQYTVLEPEDDTGNVRLRLRAYPVDVDTDRPLARGGWEATYVLAEDEAVWVSGDRIPADYEALVAPTWLIDWPIAEREHRPEGPLHPGAEWQAPTTIPLPEITEMEQTFPLTGQLVEWIDTEEIGPVAHITEFASGTGTLMDDVFDDLPARFEFDVEAYQHYYVAPGQFPLAAEQFMAADMTVHLASDEGPMAGISGHAEFQFVFAQSYERDVSGQFPWPVADAASAGEAVLSPGAPVTGMLGGWSDVLDDGTYVDVYTMYGQANDRIVLQLDSDDFDAYLFLIDDQGLSLEQDDDSGEGLNALIRYTLPYTGKYKVWVNTWDTGEAGLYRLSLEVFEPFDLDAALALVGRLHAPDDLTGDDLDEIEWTLYDLLEFVSRLSGESDQQ